MPKKPKVVSNGYDQKQLEGYLTEIDTADDALLDLRLKYMERCKGPRADIAAVFETAKEAGIPDRAFRAVARNHRLERKIARNTENLEADDRDSYEGLLAALGDFVDLPLGEAAVGRARLAEALDGLA